MPAESMYEFETDLKQNGSNSRFYKYVQDKNICKFRGNLKNRMKIGRKVTSETITIEKPQTRIANTGQNTVLLNATSARRAVSEVNINTAEETERQPMIAMNSESMIRRQYSTSTNRDDYNERRWSTSTGQSGKLAKLMGNQ